MFRRFGTKLTDAPGRLTKVATASSEAGNRTNAAEKQIAGAPAAGVTNSASDDSSRLSLELAYGTRRASPPVGAYRRHRSDRSAHGPACDPPARPRPRAGGHDAKLVTLTDGAEVLVRTARPDDAVPLQAMHSRCSPESLYLRYFGTTSQLPATLLPVLLGLPPSTVALVAETRDRRVVGLANLVTNDDATGEVALLVEDSWQRRGLGTALVCRLVAIALDRDLHALTAVTLRSNGRPARVLARAGLSVEVHVADDLLELRTSLWNGTGHAASPHPGCACPSRPARTSGAL